MKKHNIPVFRPSIPEPQSFMSGLTDIYDSGQVTNFGKFAQEFEKIAEKELKTTCFAVSSCDIGLNIVLQALKERHKDNPNKNEVIVSNFTFTSTYNCIEWNGLKPVIIDIDPETLNIDPNAVAANVDENTLCILATHIFGNPCALRELEKIANVNKVELIFDAAHAYGSKYYDDFVGDLFPTAWYGHASIYSFSGTKLVTSGEGGIITNVMLGHEFNHMIEHMRAYGFQGDYNAKYLGMNGKISELNALMGTLTLPDIDKHVKYRNEVVELYKHLFAENDINVKYQKVRKKDVCTYKDFVVIFETEEIREHVEKHLTKVGIQTKRYFRPLSENDHYKNGFGKHDKSSHVYHKNSYDVYVKSLCLPIFNDITNSEVMTVVDEITQAYRQVN